MARPSSTGGKTSKAKANNASPAKGRKTTKTKRRIAPAATRVKRRPVSDPSKDLKEARDQQAATAEILKVIASSPSDVQPVFDAIAHSAKRLIGGFSTAVHRVIDDIDHLVAFTPTNPESDEVLKAAFPRHRSEMPAIISLVENGETAQIVDSETADGQIRKLARARGWRSATYTPLMNQGTFIGFIVCTRRETGMLADHHVQLLRTFADQAVIAIENARLFNETKEALERQTATSEVLEVISASAGELEPVFQKMLENATRVCGAQFGVMSLWDGTHFNFAAGYDVPPAFAAARKNTPIPPIGALAKVIETRRFFHIHDVRSSPGYLARAPHTVEIAELAGARTLVIVPMLKENELIGIITIYRQEVKPFTDKQIALVENFTKQAVIAIENTRLLKELRKRTDDLSESLEQQTATSEVLEVISASTGELEPVFKSMLDNATRICGANFGTMSLHENGAFRPVAFYNVPQAYAEKYADTLIRPHPQGPLGTVARTHEVVHVEDTKSLPVYIEGNPAIVAISDLAGARTIVIVPMLRENELIGTIAIYRQEVRPFSEKQISLLTNFAKQAVIAIENTRLLKELRQRTDDLSQSLDDLRSAQDRLVQTEKLASLGQLTAGIAHEIKNPLNFVNNFSGLSVELVDELTEGLKAVALDDDQRADFDELTETLRTNLQKVVQHGKRADAIVKNMLLHSRQGSGEHRRVEINALVEESLNLAYHGARAETQGFEITLERCFDPGAGDADLFPQEITRVLLNLLSNGFYATTKRKVDAGDGFEPMLSATTKNLGDKVEIRIRDNGTGIPEGVKEKIFNPFFTTKPSGEGTGLGLSMSHDIIVKQHGGSIDVDTKPGLFTEFKIVLPRTNQS